MNGYPFRKFDIQEKVVFCIRWFDMRDRSQSPTSLSTGGIYWLLEGQNETALKGYCNQALNHCQDILSLCLEYLLHSLLISFTSGSLSLRHSEFISLRKKKGSFSLPASVEKKSEEKILIGPSYVTCLPPITVARGWGTMINLAWKRHLSLWPKWVGTASKRRRQWVLARQNNSYYIPIYFWW